MITDKEKDEIFDSIVINRGLYYHLDNQKDRIINKRLKLEEDFETKEDFKNAINSLIHTNGVSFYATLKQITNEKDFLEYINKQYLLYNEYTPNNSLNWLKFTKKAIMYGFGILFIENENLKSSFLKWYHAEIEKIKEYTPQQTEPTKEIEQKKELHNHIFKENSFEIWQSMFIDFDIKKSSRTDIDFMFQVMKYSKQIHENIGLIDIQNWINTVYQISFEKIKYTNPNAPSNKKRMVIYNRIIAK